MPDLQTVLSLISQIQEARNYRGDERLGATIGELDAAAELHRLFGCTAITKVRVS